MSAVADLRKPGHAARVLVVDDDDGIRDALRMALSYDGYEVVVAANGAEGFDRLRTAPFELLIVDVMMPVVDGLSMCRAMRRRNDRTPILVLTAKTSTSDRVDGLDAGADDYMIKPFDLDELLARVRALIRRTRPGATLGRTTFGDVTIDPTTRSASRAGSAIELTKTEFDLLHLLTSNQGVVLSRQVIYERIWGCDLSASSRSLDVYVSYLRQKTEIDGLPRIIHTVRGAGFCVRADR